MARKKEVAVDTQAALAARLTEACDRITNPKPSEKGKETPQQKRDREIVKAAMEVGGCATENLIKLMEILVERPLPRIEEDGDSKKVAPVGTVLVLHSRTNSHDYPFAEPVLVVRGDFGITMTGKIGNHLPLGSVEELNLNGRKATKAEIKTLFDALVPVITTPLGGGYLWQGRFAEYAPAFLKTIGMV